MSETLAILNFLSEHELHGSVWWRCDGEYAPVTWFVNCNDLFYWGSADCEKFTAADLPAMAQAIADAGDLWGLELWCCRKRGMRPQRPAYPNREAEMGVCKLFDACGPERNPAEEG